MRARQHCGFAFPQHGLTNPTEYLRTVFRVECSERRSYHISGQSACSDLHLVSVPYTPYVTTKTSSTSYCTSCVSRYCRHTPSLWLRPPKSRLAPYSSRGYDVYRNLASYMSKIAKRHASIRWLHTSTCMTSRQNAWRRTYRSNARIHSHKDGWEVSDLDHRWDLVHANTITSFKTRKCRNG